MQLTLAINFIYHTRYHIFMEKPPMKVLLCISYNVPTFCGIDMLFCVRRSLFPSQSRFGGFSISDQILWEALLSNTWNGNRG